MSLSADQRRMLDASLSREHVKQRKGGQNGLSYVEGWHVIAEMNRIFGQGSWGYECTPTLANSELLDDGDKGKRWHVTYTASCRLTVAQCLDVVDHGAGHGIDKDRGLALESAIKEACTDALKRCAKSYGNVLGLALYDRDQRNVSDTAPVMDPPDLLDRLRREDAAAKELVRTEWRNYTDPQREAIEAVVDELKQKKASR